MLDRPYQTTMHNDIFAAWAAGHRNVGAVLPTGGGKTHVFSGVLKERMKQKPVVAIAHRKELVGQIALALARRGVRHTVIGPTSLVKYCIQYQQQEIGTSFYNPSAGCAVIAVRTLLSRQKSYANWTHNVGTWVLDETHHLLAENEFGKAIDLFSNANGLGVTATMCRADRKGLGRHASGALDTLVEGPGMRDLIDMGYLCDYRIVCPRSDLVMDDTKIGNTGDYTSAALKAAAKRSHIVVDVVANYRKFALGKRTIVFATDIETAVAMAGRFRDDGVRAEVVTGETEDAIRTNIIRKFRDGQLDVLVNVDLFGEGFDVPAIECVMMARPTASYGLYCQMFGRALRILAGKAYGLIIDTVGNFVKHGPPDRERVWSLDGGERRPRARDPNDDVPQTCCTSCSQPYEAWRIACPYCGASPKPADNKSIEHVVGDLVELSPELLKKLRGDVSEALMSPAALRAKMRFAGASELVINSACKQKQGKLDNVATLQACMAWWAHEQAVRGRQEREIDKMFYLMFGTDRLSALTGDSAQCMTLANNIVVAMGGPRL